MAGILKKIKDSGNIDKNTINIVILSEGYTAAQQDQFFSDAQNRLNYFFGDPVFNAIQYKYNAYAIFLASTDAGVKHPHTAKDCPPLSNQPIANPTNYFGSTFDSHGIHRAVDIPNQLLVYQEIKNALPGFNMQPNYVPYVLCNSPYYAGFD